MTYNNTVVGRSHCLYQRDLQDDITHPFSQVSAKMYGIIVSLLQTFIHLL